jgi:hypothetical protein
MPDGPGIYFLQDGCPGLLAEPQSWLSHKAGFESKVS